MIALGISTKVRRARVASPDDAAIFLDHAHQAESLLRDRRVEIAVHKLALARPGMAAIVAACSASMHAPIPIARARVAWRRTGVSFDIIGLEILETLPIDDNARPPPLDFHPKCRKFTARKRAAGGAN